MHIWTRPNSPSSYCDIEAQLMKSLPEPIRNGFITVKAIRLLGVCAPGFDMFRFGIVEDLAIEDYVTSHSLKNCLLNLLKRVYKGGESNAGALEYDEGIENTYCKYAIASYICDEFQSYVANKKMPIWHEPPTSPLHLLDCTSLTCAGDENVCCRKRSIRLFLLKNMAA